MTNEDLRQALEDALHKNYMLALENDMFERYLSRHDPECLKNVAQMLEKTRHMQKLTAQLASSSPRMSLSGSVSSLPDKSSPSIVSGHSGSRYGTPSLLTTRTLGPGLKLTIERRIEMARNEVEEARKKLTEATKVARRQKLFLDAQIEELEIRISEAYEAKEEFEEEIVNRGSDPVTKKIPAERIVKFIEDWLKSADAIIERLRLKNASIKLRIKKAKQQLAQREDLGEALRAVDFEQLNIENQDCERRIEEKNWHLLEAKKITGRYSLQLTKHKQRLNELLHALDTVKREITAKQREIRKLETEHATIEADAGKTKEKLASLLSLIENYEVPDILDFVKLKIELQNLQRKHRRLQRRKKIQEIILKSPKNPL